MTTPSLLARKPLNKDLFYMAIALLSSKRSKDPSTRVGATIVKDDRIIGIGYNGFPKGICDSKLPWSKDNTKPFHEQKYPYSHHAEMNATTNRTTEDVRGAKIYTTLHPCDRCSPILSQYGISEVYYNLNQYEGTELFDKAKNWLKQSGVKVKKIQTITQDKYSLITPIADMFHSLLSGVKSERIIHPGEIYLDLSFGHTDITPHDPTANGRVKNPDENPHYISWNSYFMGIAQLARQRSKDPTIQEGACLVSPDKRVIGIGYNAPPSNYPTRLVNWGLAPTHPSRNIVMSAAINALANAPARPDGSTLYVTHKPNHMDTKMLIPEGVEKIVYGHELEGEQYLASQKMIDESTVTLSQFEPDLDHIVLNLSGIENEHKVNVASY